MELNYLLCGCLIVIIIIILVFLYRGKEPRKPTKLKEKSDSLFKHKKQIAIVSTFQFHIECVGFILEYLKDYDIHLYLDGDMVNYIDYFKTKYKVNHYHINNFDETKYDTIIKLTSNDPYNINKKHFSILHLSGNEYPDKKNNTMFITLSPFVKPINFNYKYILPLYKDYIDTNSLNKNISFIGNFIPNFVTNQNDIITLVNNINGNLFCLGYNTQKFNNNRIISYDNISTIDMVEKLKQCSYIIIKEHDDRYSGGITTALSLNIPLIMKKSIADSYNIPAITYNNNINELTSFINNLSFNNYMKIKNNLRDFTDKQIEINKQRLINILPKNDGSC